MASARELSDQRFRAVFGDTRGSERADEPEQPSTRFDAEAAYARAAARLSELRELCRRPASWPATLTPKRAEAMLAAGAGELSALYWEHNPKARSGPVPAPETAPALQAQALRRALGAELYRSGWQDVEDLGEHALSAFWYPATLLEYPV